MNLQWMNSVWDIQINKKTESGNNFYYISNVLNNNSI